MAAMAASSGTDGFSPTHPTNVVAALAILLAAVAIGSLGLCIATLLGLRLRVLPPSPGFAGDAVMLEVRVDNPGPRFRWDIGIGLEAEQQAAPARAWPPVPTTSMRRAPTSWPPPPSTPRPRRCSRRSRTSAPR